MNLRELRQLRTDLDGRSLMAVVEIDIEQLEELLDLAEATLRRQEDRTRPIRVGKTDIITKQKNQLE